MEKLSEQIADLGYPFPAQFFEQELIKNEVPFREITKTNADSSFSSRVYFVGIEDIEKANSIKNSIEIDNAKSEEKFRNPIRKILAYIVLILIAIYVIFDLFKVFK